MTDIVKLYNPANAAALSPEEISGLQKLDSAQIKELALAYPNMSINKNYLLIIDKNKPVEKQMPALSTFENLWNLREKNALRQYVAYAFRGNVQPKSVASKARKTEVLDLSETELMTLPGFKKAAGKTPETNEPANGLELPKTVKVTKIKKVPIKK